MTLEWDANTESNLAGYKVYVGSQSRQYDTVIDVGLATQESLPSLPAGHAYYFAVTAYDSDGLESEFSDEVTYAVSDLTTATPLVNVTVCEGGTASFATTVTGNGPFLFAWRKDGVVIDGAATASLTLAPANAADAGTYAVEVRGPGNAVTNAASLAVNALTTATSPANVTVCAGGAASFATTVAGTGPFTFVWKKNGVAIDGATNALLTQVNVSATGAGIYTVEVSGACNTVTNSAALTVNEETTATPLANAVVYAGEAATFATAVAGTGPFEFVWKKDGAVIAGADSAVLVIPEVNVTDAGNYTVEIRGTCNTVARAAVLAVSEPTTATPLAGVTTCAGTAASFFTTAAGRGPLGFVWKKEGLVIAGATNAVFTISEVGTNDAGTYTVEVTGADNTVTSSASLTLNELLRATPLTNATAYAGERASFAIAVTGTGPFGFVWRKDGVMIDGATNQVFAIPAVHATNAGSYAVEVTGACDAVTNSAVLAVQLNETNALPVGLRITLADPAVPVAISFPVEAGRQYLVQASTDLRFWQTAYAVTSFTNGTNQWADADAPNHPMRFYRVLGSQP